ncbi:hypothetical protein ABT063_29215 [Streptomyces sp. NPDC002838]|uniref:hypothetical protein n=1 Tax=Streptomyces sp. NPDC002838 TaxID=3154436 RepID=UPI0033225427
MADDIIGDDGNHIRWVRNCGSTYKGYVYTTWASSTKSGDGCAGHAWLRVLGDSWGAWRHESDGHVKLTSPNGKFRKAQHKGCETCTVYTTEVK